MIYDVIVTDPARDDADQAYSWLRKQTEQYSVQWFNGLVEAIEGLNRLPNRCPLAPESRHFKEKIHQLLYGKRPHIYRVLFVVRGPKVYVLHVRHGARSAMQPEEMALPK